jgi:hypothetical protein
MQGMREQLGACAVAPEPDRELWKTWKQGVTIMCVWEFRNAGTGKRKVLGMV